MDGLKKPRYMMRATITAIGLLLVFDPLRTTASEPAGAPDPATAPLESRFRDTVHPFIGAYCLDCHGKEKREGDLDLGAYPTMEAVVSDHGRWEIVLEQLEAGAMPPSKAKRHPKAGLRRDIIDWIRALRKHEARRNAGDPGPVLARRLSNAEYDHTIRDLTGV